MLITYCCIGAELLCERKFKLPLHCKTTECWFNLDIVIPTAGSWISLRPWVVSIIQPSVEQTYGVGGNPYNFTRVCATFYGQIYSEIVARSRPLFLTILLPPCAIAWLLTVHWRWCLASTWAYLSNSLSRQCQLGLRSQRPQDRRV